MRLVWRTEARRDLDNILDFISDRNIAAAERIEAMIIDTVEHLVAHPMMYRSGRVPGTREAVAHPNYIVIYRASNEVVTILSVIHARQNYP